MNFIAKRRERQNRGSDRGELVAAARRAFTDLGPAASMAEVADAAGVSEAELAVHFGDRDALLVAVIDDLEGSLREERPVTRAPVSWPRLPARQMVPPLLAAAAVLSLGTAPPSAAVAAEDPAPATVLTISPLWPVWSIDTALEGSMCATNRCSMVPYVPFVTPDGVRALDARLSQTTGVQPGGSPTIVLGFSNGAGVAEQWMADNAGKPGAPSPEDVSFVLIGNPRRAYGGTRPPITPTDYHVIDIVRQYDPMADFPDNPLNLLALANVAAGMLSPMHLDYRSVDLDDPANVVWTEGNTTYVFVPTQDLPLLRPLRAMGMTALADALNEPLKEIVEKAYDRPYLTTPAEPSAPPEEPASADDTVVTAAATKAAVTNDVTADEPVSKPPRRKLFSKKVAAEEESTAAATSSEPAGKDEPATEPAEKPTTARDTPEAAETPTRDTTASSTSKASTPHRWGRHRQE
ncbi:PE-PPE domain-containing protein [Mycolicibacterium chubuense]|uniref:Putative PPE family protein PPE42 n=1 Tax=Mycolicibacterium chubuense TaxID=1800 RepID=A0A0J6WB37_MYCCU|nr:PE-PPE domain-containing protein [Mycolicibacterium chubuense]KMO79784.1 putative PPE family protein PPE42 [Mycolicibacterium chubuense]SPX98294.1 transcriptional regulator [Mycolicibacterium chubuense]